MLANLCVCKNNPRRNLYVCIANQTGWRQANEDDIRSFLGMPPKNSNAETNMIPWAERPLPRFGRNIKAAQAAMRKSREEFKANAKARQAAVTIPYLNAP